MPSWSYRSSVCLPCLDGQVDTVDRRCYRTGMSHEVVPPLGTQGTRREEYTSVSLPYPLKGRAGNHTRDLVGVVHECCHTAGESSAGGRGSTLGSGEPEHLRSAVSIDQMEANTVLPSGTC